MHREVQDGFLLLLPSRRACHDAGLSTLAGLMRSWSLSASGSIQAHVFGNVQAGVKEEKAFADAKVILLEMGEFFQIQDDYLDCYGAPEVIGKIGTDIEHNKCGWLVVQALARVSPAQRVVLEV